VDLVSQIYSTLNFWSDLSSFDEEQTKDLPPADISRKFNIFNSSLNCGAFTAGADANIDVNVHAVLSIGLTAKGSIVPPKLDDFSIVTGAYNLKIFEFSGGLNIHKVWMLISRARSI
jgi:hypothetical protein